MSARSVKQYNVPAIGDVNQRERKKHNTIQYVGIIIIKCNKCSENVTQQMHEESATKKHPKWYNRIGLPLWYGYNITAILLQCKRRWGSRMVWSCRRLFTRLNPDPLPSRAKTGSRYSWWPVCELYRASASPIVYRTPKYEGHVANNRQSLNRFAEAARGGSVMCCGCRKPGVADQPAPWNAVAFGDLELLKEI